MSMILYDFLPLGKDNGVKAETLIALFGLKSDRDLRHLVQQEREQGALIVSGNNGYYRPESKAELIECVRRYTAMAKHIYAIAKLARKHLESCEGQISMFDIQDSEEMESWFLSEGVDL